MPVNKENTRKWVEALRSGSYHQGKHYLRNIKTNCFCVWGVACDLIDPSGWKQYPEMDCYGYDGFGSNSEKIEEFYGIERWHEFEEWTLERLNDNGWTFEQLADLLEKEFLIENV